MNTFNLLKSGASFSKGGSNQKLLNIFSQKEEETKTVRVKDNYENLPVDTELEKIDKQIQECKEQIKLTGSKSKDQKKNEETLKSL